MHPVHRLEELLAGAENLMIVCHNNPDPDCLASAFALGRIAIAVGIDEHHILYSGDISPAESGVRQSHRYRSETLRSRGRPRSSRGVTARVRRSRGSGENNRVPEGTPVDIVIDHHPNEEIEAQFIDHREQIGATATILTEYVRELDIEMDAALGTALLFAIRRETLGFLRGVTSAEYDAAGWLHEHADGALLRTLSTPSVTGATVDTIAEAVRNRTVRGSVLIGDRSDE